MKKMTKPAKADLLITNAIILTMNGRHTVYDDGAIAITGNDITAIGKTSDLNKKYNAKQTIDASGCIVIPGLINAHTHIPMSYFKGVADDLPLNKWLNDYIWPLEQKFVVPETTEAHEFVYNATLHGAAELIKNGITLANDMYFKGEDMAEAFNKAGVRCIIGEPLIEEGKEANLRDIGKLALDLKNVYMNNPLLDFSLAPHAIYTNNSEVLKRCAEVAQEQNMLVHMHISEADWEKDDCLTKHGKKPIEYLEELGLLNTKIILAHGIHVDVAEMDILDKHQASIAICTESNLKLANGFAPIKMFLQHKVRLCFGTDSVASNNNLDLLSELDLTAKVHKALGRKNPRFLPARKILDMATIGAAIAIHKDKEIGSLKIGKKADITILNCNTVEAQPLYCPYSQVIYALGGKAVRDVIINGKFVLKNKKLTTLDESELIAKAKEYKIKILKELKELKK